MLNFSPDISIVFKKCACLQKSCAMRLPHLNSKHYTRLIHQQRFCEHLFFGINRKTKASRNLQHGNKKVLFSLLRNTETRKDDGDGYEKKSFHYILHTLDYDATKLQIIIELRYIFDEIFEIFVKKLVFSIHSNGVIYKGKKTIPLSILKSPS